MITVFDRHLLRTYLWTFCVTFVCVFGLFVVIDLMDNFDDFVTNTEGEGNAALVLAIVRYYSYYSSFILDRAGWPLTIVSAVVVLFQLQRRGELKPLLAAGVPTWRITAPVVCGVVLAMAGVVANRELVVPRIAHTKYEGRGKSNTRQGVEAVYDHSTRILLDAEFVYLSERRIEQASFVLPAADVTDSLTTLNAREAVFHPQTENRPAGWRLKDVDPPYERLHLTEAGREVVRPVSGSDDVFVVTPVSSDLLYRHGVGMAMLSTPELVDRVNSPAFASLASRRIQMALHERLVQPLLVVAAALLVIPLMIRRNSRSLIADAAVTAMVFGALFGLQEGCSFLGQTTLVSPAFAAWIPVIAGGSAVACLQDVVAT